MSERTSPAPELREAIAPFRAMYRDLVASVEALPDSDLRRLASMPPFFGQTNCAWDEYAAVRIVAPIARGELSRRESRRIARARPVLASLLGNRKAPARSRPPEARQRRASSDV